MDHVRAWTVQITITEHVDERQSRQDAGGVQVACRYSAGALLGSVSRSWSRVHSVRSSWWADR
jgi:hypothetical protein